MKFYLTGGAIRDEILGEEVRDRDYIILDADKDELLKLKYTSVGKDFEVFLHPETKDEYTLALDNNLYKELERRDLTVNSIAKNIATGDFYDPFSGIKDIEDKVLRHTSESFVDDPIRILRVARFKSQYENFEISRETIDLCCKLSKEQNLFDDIAGERFLLELKKALMLESATIFFSLLKEWGTLHLFFPELAQLDISKGNYWNKTMGILEKACSTNTNFSIRFSLLIHAFGECYPIGLYLFDSTSDRFKVDKYTKSLSLAVCRFHLSAKNVFELEAEDVLQVLIGFNALREGRLFEDALLCCSLIAGSKEFPRRDYLIKIAKELKYLSYEDLIEKYKGRELGEKIQKFRIKKIVELSEST